MKCQIKIRGHTIHYLAKDQCEATLVDSLVHSIGITGDEAADRVLIQTALRDVPCFTKCSFYYDGNIVYPLDEIVANFVELKKRGNLSYMSHPMKEFLFLNIGRFDERFEYLGHIGYYHNSFENMWHGLEAFFNSIPAKRTDIQQIAMCISQIMH